MKELDAIVKKLDLLIAAIEQNTAAQGAQAFVLATMAQVTTEKQVISEENGKPGLKREETPASRIMKQVAAKLAKTFDFTGE